MNENLECPVCQNGDLLLNTVWETAEVYFECDNPTCWFRCNASDVQMITRTMESLE